MTTARKLIPDIDKLQAFECAARHGSFTQAARELNLTQSAVSRQIKELENQLGVALFERVRQRVLLSAAGQRFLPEVRRLLAQSEEAMLRVMTSPSASSLSLATLPAFGARWLVPRLPNFLSRNPDIALNIVSRSQPFDLEESVFDAAIHYGQPIWAHATCRYICREEILPVAAPAFLARHGGNTIKALEAGPLLHLATRPKAWADWFQSVGSQADTVYRGHRFDQFMMVIQAAIAGLGFALLPRYLIEQELRDEILQVVIDRSLPTENSYYFVVPDGRLENPLANELYEWIIGQVKKRTP
ncbi:LysR family transcriptional regulator [Aquamicrobium sp. LC103]|uniref:LysR family transcriptional regulator n=1 Tax=Aquamicrobium sp. LC103 TaxID=1120658 RepID=UPI00063EBB39|nr:LysR family transcriptional regulator [Aquamicrobium sp. LC103]TKT75863.1 LysR family transcriptional regulator [Aquamicrobium sp. LC103]